MRTGRAAFCLLIGLSVLPFAAARAEQWDSIGPFGAPLINNDVISGQVNAIAVDPRDANVLYIGASEGGVWKTANGGATWTPLTDTKLVRKLPSGKTKGTLSIGALAINPTNPDTIYAGTGDPNIAFRFPGPGLGVFRSTDGGSTWTPLGVNLTRCQNGAMSRTVVNRLVVMPGRPAVLFAATNLGLFRYAETGNDCWRYAGAGLPPSGNAIDLVADPNQGALYVAYWSIGIFKSTSLDGTQWAMLAGGLPNAGFGRIALAYGGRSLGFRPPLPIVYAGFDAGSGTYRLFVTRDGGSIWTELPSPPSDGQLSFNNVIAVGSYDPDEVYIGQIGLWRATDGGRMGGKNDYKPSPPIEGNSWTALSCCLAHASPNPYRKNLDLHGDQHDIVFAPYGSFQPSPSQVQIVYVANDGGVTKGTIDFEGVVSWEPLTKGLAIGQAGTIGLAPGSQDVTVAGYWHNGDILTFSPSLGFDPLAIVGGDGFQTTVDAGNLIVYYNCNAGFGNSICRALPPPPFFTNFKLERIWDADDEAVQKHWSDPHRPGHLLRLQNIGLLFRTTKANTASTAELKSPDAWEAIDPFWGKTGMTTTMAFRSRRLEEATVYYLGTDSGQVWRGSPEVGWIKLCECGAAINAIAPDLFRDERIFVVQRGLTSPGRIKELKKSAGGAWEVRNIDATFAPELDVAQVTSVVVDPKVPASRGTTIYVGTDQGVYRGHADTLVLDPTTVAVVPPPIFGDWTWRRSAGVPNVWVTDLEVHQNFQGHDGSGVIRAGTYGRGIYELNRSRGVPPGDVRPPVLSVEAVQMLEDGAPSYPHVEIPVVLRGEKMSPGTPFEMVQPKGTQVTLEAPQDVRIDGAELKFVGWVINGRRERSRTVSLTLDDAIKAVAYYEGEEAAPGSKSSPLQMDLTATTTQHCVQRLTHDVTLSWKVTGGRPPVRVEVHLTYPDGHVENVGLKPIEGAQDFPMSAPEGGRLHVGIVATDAGKAASSAQTTVELRPCDKARAPG